MSNTSQEADNCESLSAAVRRGEVTLIARSRGQYPGVTLPKAALPGLRTIGYWDAVGPQTWGLPMHRNEGIEICYVISGETRFATDDSEWTLRAGDITITRPWQRHCLGNPTIGACKLFWVIIDVETSDERSSAWEFPDWIGPDMRSRKELLRIFRKNQGCRLVDKGAHLKEFMLLTCDKLTNDSPLALAQLANQINTLLLTVAEHLSVGMVSDKMDPQGFDQTIRQFFRGLETSIDKAAEPWSVGDIAHTCRVGKSYLTSSCRQIFNATPAEQLNRIRLNHARDLLLNTPSYNITEIAFAVGFNTSQYFANRFRKQFGLTPQHYRSAEQHR